MERTHKRQAGDLEGERDRLAASIHAENTEVDSNPVIPPCGNGLSQKTKIPKKDLPNPGVSEDAEEYFMRNTKRGVAIIFNHYEYDIREYPNKMLYRPPIRDGTHVDRDILKKTFSNLGFEVECLEDKRYEEIEKKLTEVALQDHSGCDCLAVVVLTHGEAGGRLDAYDQAYDARKLWEPFTARSCSSLAGKPKLFFIQACKGTIGDPGTKVKYCINESPDAVPGCESSFRVPSYADILVSYSTFEGLYSFRDITGGSWYVQTLCALLEKDAGAKDLVSLLTSVNRIVGQTYFAPSYNSVQGPCFISSLTRQVHLWPPVASAVEATPTSE